MFELADGGTLLLDEIGDMDFKLQAKLLQVLQDQEFQRLGGKGDRPRRCARPSSNAPGPGKMAITDRRFREDLYYRLNVINMRIPALRERKEDVLAFTEFLLKSIRPKGIAVPVITDFVEASSFCSITGPAISGSSRICTEICCSPGS